MAGEIRPDVVIGSCGGGSNLGGIALPFVPDERAPGRGRAVVVPTLTEGRFEYDFGDTAGMTPAPDVHARPRLRAAVDPCRRPALPRRLADHLVAREERTHGGDRVSAGQDVRGRRAVRRAEGKIPAPETGHAIRAVIDEALAAKEPGEERVILFNYSGHGLLDLSAYDDYLHGRLVDA